jgi:tetratricopeptide (TPR) repeat protein
MSMTTRASASTIILRVVLSLGLTLASMSVMAQKKEQVSQKMGAPLQSAMSAAKNKQYDVALAKLKEAEAIPGKTAFEQYKIYEIYEFTYAQQKKYAELASVYEKMLQTPQFLPPGKAESLPKSIAQSYAAVQQHAKVIEFGSQWLKTHPTDTDMAAMLGQTYYATKDYKQCREIMTGLISHAEKSGTEPKEAWLQFAQTCSSALDDNDGVMSAYEKLVRYYPKVDWWSQYIKRMSRDERSDTASFEWLRLKMDVGILKEPSEYMEFTQSAMIEFDSGVEAQRIAELGYSKQVLGTDAKNKVRHDTLLEKAREASRDAKAKLPSLVAQAEKSSTGEIDAQIGMTHYGSEQYDQAIKSLDTAIKKGGLKDVGTAKMTLGIAYLRKGQRDQARATFKSLAGDSQLAKAAAAWTLRTYN